MRRVLKWGALALSLLASVAGTAQASFGPRAAPDTLADKEINRSAGPSMRLDARLEEARRALDIVPDEDARDPRSRIAQWFNWPNWDNWPNWNNWGNWANWLNW